MFLMWLVVYFQGLKAWIVLASGGWEKSTAILAAIRLLKPQVLITDETVAETLVNG